MSVIAHLVQGLCIGGMERGTLQLAARGRREGQDHRLILFDHPLESSPDQFSPEGVPVLFVPRKPGIDLLFPVRLARVLRQWRVDILHARNHTALIYGAMAGKLLLHSPALVATFHNYPCHPTRAARKAAHWLSRDAEAILSVSQDLEHLLLQDGWVCRCRTIHNGVDTAQFTPSGPVSTIRRRLGLAAGTMLIGSLGRLDPIKRQHDLVAAARLLAEDPAMRAFHVVIIGAGPLRQSLSEAAGSCGHVTVLPPEQDTAAILRELDVLVLCSQHEGLPRILLEAIAVGTPVVATAVGGIPELLEGLTPGSALQVPAADPPALARAVRQMTLSGNRRGAAPLPPRWSAQREWLEYSSVYRDALRSRPLLSTALP